MLIPDADVKDWKDLQDKVAAFFLEMGYHAVTPADVELSGRGVKEVDALVEDKRASVRTLILAECKWWGTAIPQDVVHAFSTVVQGAGANFGFIISRVGFQAGALEATKNTNITLLTFEQLQQAYGAEWYRVHLEQLLNAERQLRSEYDLHFAQDTTLPLMNSWRFHSAELRARLYDYYEWMSLLLGLVSERPRSFDVKGTIRTQHEPNPPWSEEYKNTPAGHEFASVRDYFQRVTQAINDCLHSFTQFCAEALASFEQLPEAGQDRAWGEMMFQLAEESPLRTLKRSHSQTEYEAILRQHLAATAEALPKSPPAQTQT